MRPFNRQRNTVNTV